MGFFVAAQLTKVRSQEGRLAFCLKGLRMQRPLAYHSFVPIGCFDRT
jgi:hypothetical protein